MQQDIHENLRRLLAGGPIHDDAKVIYLLVDARKLIEHEKTLKRTLRTLEFYCNWGLHVQLNRPSAQAFLDFVKPILTLNAAFSQEQHDAFHTLLTLDAFRLELRSVLPGFGTNLAICDDPECWRGFLRAYSAVVQDTELAFTGNFASSGPLELTVKKVTIRPVLGDQMADPAVKVYPMTWLIEYADGRTGRLELSQFGLLGAAVEIFPAVPATTGAA